MDPSRSAFAAIADCVPPSASVLREEVFEQDRRRASIDVTCAAKLGLARGVALVVQPNWKPELLRGGREAPDALGLVPFLASQGQRESDDQRVDLFLACAPPELGEIFDDAPSHKRSERSRETVRLISDGESDSAVANVERKVAQTSGRPRRDGRLDLDRDSRVEDGETRPPRRPRFDVDFLEPAGRGDRVDVLEAASGKRGSHLGGVATRILLRLGADAPLHSALTHIGPEDDVDDDAFVVERHSRAAGQLVAQAVDGGGSRLSLRYG